MKALQTIHDGLKRMTALPRHEQDWVTAELRALASPQNANAMAKLWKSLLPDGKPASVFLSHNSKDKPFARSVYRYLSDRGLKVWIDEAELNAGDSLAEALAKAVFEVDCVVAIISTASVKSNWVKKELAWAMNREIKGRRVRVIPIKKDDASIPKVLSDKLYLDFSTTYRRTKNMPVLLSGILEQTARPARHASLARLRLASR